MKELEDIICNYICSFGITCMVVKIMRARSRVFIQCLLVYTSCDLIKEYNGGAAEDPSGGRANQDHSPNQVLEIL